MPARAHPLRETTHPESAHTDLRKMSQLPVNRGESRRKSPQSRKAPRFTYNTPKLCRFFGGRIGATAKSKEGKRSTAKRHVMDGRHLPVVRQDGGKERGETRQPMERTSRNTQLHKHVLNGSDGTREQHIARSPPPTYLQNRTPGGRQNTK